MMQHTTLNQNNDEHKATVKSISRYKIYFYLTGYQLIDSQIRISALKCIFLERDKHARKN